MITSKENEKLKLVRKLGQKKHRRKLGMFVTEGEDLAEAGLAAGHEPVGLLVHPDSGIPGEKVEPQLLDGVADPGNIGTIIRTADALVGGAVVLGPGSADPFSAIAVRASMGSIFTQPVARAEIGATPAPRIALALGGSEAPGPVAGPATLCFGSEREGLSPDVLKECEVTWTIPQRPGGAQSLNVAAAAAIACERISSPPEDASTQGNPGS